MAIEDSSSIGEITGLQSMKQALPTVGVSAIAILGAVIFAFPFYYITIGSTLEPGVILQFPPRLLPGSNALENYSKLLTETAFLTALKNSLIYAVGSTVGVLIVATAAGYAFAKFAFPGRSVLFYITLSSLAIPFQLIAIPLFKLLVDFGLADTYIGLILPAVTHPIGVFFMKQNIEQTVVDDLLNSARVDGASELQTFFHIVVPVIRPALAALAVLMFLLRMNEFYWPLIVMRSPEHQVGTIFLAELHGGVEQPTPWTLMAPAAVLLSLPVLLIFIFLQKHFVKGLLQGSVKQ